MKVAITGASGFVGQGLCQTLNEHNIAYSALTRAPSLIDGSLSRAVNESSPDSVIQAALSGCNTLVHLAALTHQPSQSPFANLEEFRRVNVVFTRNLALAAAAEGVKRIVFMSSTKVYGDSSTSISPDTPETPSDAYGQTKLEAEEALRHICHESGMDLVIIRPPLIFAPHAKGNLAALVKATRWKLPLPLASIHNQRDLLSLPNLCELILICLSHPNATRQAWLASDGQPISTAAIIRALAHTHKRKPLLLPFPERWLKLVGAIMGRQHQLDKLIGDQLINSNHTQDALGWQPQTLQALYLNPQDQSLHASD